MLGATTYEEVRIRDVRLCNVLAESLFVAAVLRPVVLVVLRGCFDLRVFAMITLIEGLGFGECVRM